MMLTRSLLLAGVLIAALLAAGPAAAEQFVSDGPIQVHYSAMTADDLTPEIARALGVTRTDRKALVVIHAQHVDGATRTSRTPTVTGTASNLAAQVRKLDFRVVEDAGVEYAIATVSVANLETLRFDLTVAVQDHQRPLSVRFSRKFYR